MAGSERPDRLSSDPQLAALIAALEQILLRWEARMLAQPPGPESETYELHAALNHIRAALACFRALAGMERDN
jgi:hypothetical protein